MRITTKITLITAIILIVIIAVQTINATVSVNNIITSLEENDKQHQQNGLNNEIRAKFEMLAISQIPIANDPEILAAFAARDREALAALTLPMMEQLDAQGIKQFHFHLPDATSFFRVQKPEEFGDDLSSFRKTVVQANNDEQTVEGLEGGVSGVGFRYVVPLSFQGQHIGTVELGLGLEQEFIDNMKEDYNSEWVLYGLEDNKPSYMLGTLPEYELTFSDEKLQQVQQGETIEQLVDYLKVTAFPLTDFSGEVKWFLLSIKDYTTILDKENSVLINILISSVILSIIGLLIIIWILRRTLSPLSVLSRNAEMIAEGDLTIEQPTYDSKDEIGILSSSFNKMTTSLKTLIRDIQSQSNELSENATSISENLAESKEVTNEIVRSIEIVSQDSQQAMLSNDETAKAMGEIAQGIVRVADNTSNIANSSGTINEVTHEGNTAVQSAIMQMDVIEQRMDQFATVIGELKVDSNQIGSIMQIITGIAEQTNLLALNAAIEAARAGEAGKGFAVVADEIRKLADQTSNSASKVHKLIFEIQSKTETAVEAMDVSKSEVQQGTALIDEVGSLFSKIEQAIGGLSVDIDELSALSEQISAGTQQITASMQEVAHASVHSAESANSVAAASEQQLAGIEEISLATKRLSDMSKHLEDSVNHFKI